MSIEPEPIILPDLGPMYDAVGKGISLFSTIEMAVGFVFASLLEPADRGHSIAAINASRSFEAKMKMVDALAAAVLEGDQLKRWRNLSSKIGKRKDVRDKLAHWMVSHWPGIRSVSAKEMKKVKVALVPPIWKADHMQVMWLPQHERDVQPLFLRDIEEYGRKAVELTTALFNFSSEISRKDNGQDAA